MKKLLALLVLLIAGICAGTGSRRRPGDHQRGGGEFPLPDLLPVGLQVRADHRGQAQLPVHRLRRRDHADQGEDGRFRRLRRARSRPRSSSRPAWSSSRWSSAAWSRSSTSGHRLREDQAHAGAARRHLPRKGEALGRPGAEGREPRRESARRRRSSSCTAPTAPARPGSSPTTSTRSRRSGTARSATEKAVSWPAGVGGKGNEGVAAFVQQAEGTIGYVEYAYAVQNKLATVQLRNRAGKYVAALDRIVPGGRGRGRLEGHAGLLAGAHRPAGRGELADHRRLVHPRPEGAGRCRARQGDALLLRLVPRATAPRRPRSSTTSRSRPA